MKVLTIIFVVPIVVVLGMQAWRWSDNRHADQVWQDLMHKPAGSRAVFDVSMVEGLPEPARRYFLFTIKPGTALSSVAEIRMGGEIGLGTRDEPNYLPMRCHQLLAPPYGFVWKLTAGQGAMRISGSDGVGGGRSWVRFWLLGTIPIVRAGGDEDNFRSAFGRMVSESVFLAPAALLPGEGVSWEAVGDDVARASVSHNGITQSVDITVAEDGRPTKVVIARWSDANPEKRYRLQPFGGHLSEFREFDGYRLPTRIEGGNFIDTEEYYPFYKARISEVRFVIPR